MTEFVDPQWKKQYEQLVAFKRKHGHCIVPQRYQGDASLGKWVSNQRRINVNNKLRVDRKGLLDEIGFVWRVYCTVDKDTPWNKQYEKLVEFKRKNGHCLVPKRYEDDTSLAIWVSTQRASNILPLDRKDLLNKLGFVWRIDKDASWNKQYEKLLAFKRKNGHCLVPQRYQGDVSFGKWVANQRNFHSNNKIRPDRKKLLDEIGFVRKADTRTAHSSTTDDSDSEASNGSVGLPNETPEETGPGQGHGVISRFACPSPNIKRPRACLAGSGQMAARTNQTGGGEDDSKSSQAGVQEEATHDKNLPFGWKRVKLEPDC